MLAVPSGLLTIWVVFRIAAPLDEKGPQVAGVGAVVRSLLVAPASIAVRDMGVYELDAQLVRLISKLVAVLVMIYILVHRAESSGTGFAFRSRAAYLADPQTPMQTDQSDRSRVPPGSRDEQP
jgi:hypothetical protein